MQNLRSMLKSHLLIGPRLASSTKDHVFKSTGPLAFRRMPSRDTSPSFHSLGGLQDKSAADSIDQKRQPATRSNPKVQLYKTRESVEQVLSSDKYQTLTKSGWVVNELCDPQTHLSIVVLQKTYREPFYTWDVILDWLRVAITPIAKELNHHPDVAIENCDTLRLTLFTHSLKALTMRDFRMALRLSKFEQTLKPRGSA